MKDIAPTITESESKVNNTLMLTLPQRIVVRRKLESLRIDNTVLAPGLRDCSASISRRKRVKLKNARLRPEDIADCDMQNAIPIHVSILFILKIKLLLRIYIK